MSFLTPRHDPWFVATSISIAVLAAYVALDLVERLRANTARIARAWWIGGSIATGTGIWSMHFVGLLALILPIRLGYTSGWTLLSWLAAMGVSGIALGVAGRGEFGRRRLTTGALAMGIGLCGMHYAGMAALDMAPGIVWDPWRVALSVLIAVGAAAAALSIFFWLRQIAAGRRQLYKLAAATVMGLALSGMHYTGTTAAAFAVGSVCLSADQLGGGQLGALVILGSAALLMLTLFTATLDARMQDQAALLAHSLRSVNVQLQEANDELKKRAFLDPLTRLPNRLLFEDRLAHALALSERHRAPLPKRLAVLFVDLDGFKPVNDSLGHAAGDQVLVEVAARLLSVARESDTVARVGGDEFVLLMEDVAEVADCAGLARRLVASIALPFVHGERVLQISASVGIAVFPDHGKGDQLMVHADAAMYAAKRAGGNACMLFELHMNSGVARQLVLQTDLRRALARGELSLYYQPKLDGRRLQIRGVEALMRWNHPEHGEVPPSVFIPIAERFGLIMELGEWVINEACRQMRAWDEAGMHLRVAVNLSVQQLRQEGLVRRLGDALVRHGIDASRLLCEITESVAMEDIETTQRAFEGLGRIGVFLSIDDFGTGYSSLSYLRKLPARQLKIDRSFVQDLETSQDARAVVDAVIRLAHALDLSVVAEGVETPGQRDILLALACDELQGFLFAEPMPAAQLLDWARGNKPGGTAEFSPSVMAPLV